MSENLVLYCHNGSPPVRAVYLVAAALNLNLKRKTLDLFKAEHMTPEYSKLNPQRSVPLLLDNDKPLWDSHAIITYLVRKFGGEDHPLYPADCFTRAKIDQCLQFESTVLYRALTDTILPIYFQGAYEIGEKGINSSIAAYKLLETFLSDGTFLVGDQLTLADLSMITTLTQLMYAVPIEPAKFTKLSAWIKEFDALPYFHAENTLHRLEYIKTFDGICAKNREAAKKY